MFVLGLIGLRGQDLTLVKAWESEAVFKTPESVVYDSLRHRLYVSNYNRFPRGEVADDCISILDMEGRVVELRWITGLQAPTGLFIKGSSLYVVERDGISIFETETGTLLDKKVIDQPGFLNDVVVRHCGAIYYTDTSPRAAEQSYIGRLMVGRMDTLINESVNRSNGLSLDRNFLLLGNSGDQSLKRIEARTGICQTVAVLDSGIIDGIRVFDKDRYLVSHWEGRLFLVSEGEEPVVLLDLRDEGINLADFEYIARLRMLIFPTFKGGKVIAYTLK